MFAQNLRIQLWAPEVSFSRPLQSLKTIPLCAGFNASTASERWRLFFFLLDLRRSVTRQTFYEVTEDERVPQTSWEKAPLPLS